MILSATMPGVFAIRYVAASAFTSPKAQGSGEFGWSVAISGTVVVVGARIETADGSLYAGHSYIFSRSGSLIATLTSPNAAFSGDFGFSVAVSGNTIVVGAPYEPVAGAGLAAGHAYIFSTAGHLIATLTSPNPEFYGYFGFSVAVSGASIVVGAPDETASGFRGQGRAYIFNSTGSLISTLISPNPSFSYSCGSGFFGGSVAISGTRIVVGAPCENATGFEGAGHAYIFDNSGSMISTLTSPNAQTKGEFGSSVAVSGASLVVGTPYESGGAGHAYIFSTSGRPIATLTSPNPKSSTGFGSSVAVSSTSIVIGEAANAYIFRSTGRLISILTSPSAQIDAGFGFSVSISGTIIVVGAPLPGAGTADLAGRAYLFIRHT